MSIAEALCPFTMPMFAPNTEPANPFRSIEIGDWLRIDFDGDEGKHPEYRRVCVVGDTVCHVPMPDHMKENLQTMRFWLEGPEAGREVCRPDKAYRATARPATAEEIAAYESALLVVVGEEGGEG